GVATVSASTFGFAPGYTARTTTVGGAISGYCAMGNWNTAIPPTSTMTMDRTAAKIGRRMKKWEKFMRRETAMDSAGRIHEGNEMRGASPAAQTFLPAGSRNFPVLCLACGSETGNQSACLSEIPTKNPNRILA